MALVAADHDAIAAIVTQQGEAWSRGDLDGYLAGYARSEALVFAWDGHYLRGFDAMHAGYHERYDGKQHVMGTLRLDLRHVEELGPGVAVAVGTWTQTDNPHPGEGVFTFVLAKRDDRWAIVVDHSSGLAP